MKKKLTLVVAVLAVGSAFVEARSDSWGGLGSAYAQAQGLVKSHPVKTTARPSFIAATKSLSGDKLSVEGKSGDITVKPGKPGEIRYEVSYCRQSHGWNLNFFNFHSGCKESKEYNPRNTVDFDPSQSRLAIHAAKYWDFNATVWIPQNIQLAVKSRNGDVYIDSLMGKASIISTSGDIKVNRQQGALNITINSGNVIVKDSKGKVDIQSQSGNVKIASSDGPIQVITQSGNTYIDGGYKGIHVKSVSGKVSVVGGSSQTNIDVISGDIVFSPSNLKPSQCIQAKTESGNLKVKRSWPICEKSTVSLSVESGDIIIK